MQELLNMAQAVLVEYEAAGVTDVSTVGFAARVAHRAVLAEREACAKVCDEMQDIRNEFMANDGAIGIPYVPQDCGGAIRMRFNNEVQQRHDTATTKRPT